MLPRARLGVLIIEPWRCLNCLSVSHLQIPSSILSCCSMHPAPPDGLCFAYSLFKLRGFLVAPPSAISPSFPFLIFGLIQARLKR